MVGFVPAIFAEVLPQKDGINLPLSKPPTYRKIRIEHQIMGIYNGLD
jgi:hypothetical protein